MEEIQKQELTSMNIQEAQLQKLKELFPEAFTEGLKVDWDKLRLALGETVDTGKERYGMNWPGKADCFKTIQQPSIATLVPARDESIDFDTTQNLFIEGDNLEVLKLLQKSYLGKIKMIYIDPPYNTGNDFIYPDNYSENLDTYLEYTGQIDGEGRKFATNTETDGRFHSKWMNMMYPRLFLAKNLLKEDGVIFISIDDAEIINLRSLCNEIFGEENFISQIIIQSNKRGQTYKDISKTHEYLLVFSKSDAYSLFEIEKNSDSLPFEDSKGKFDLWELRNRNPKFGRHNRPNLYFPIYVAPEELDEKGYSKISLKKDLQFSVEVFPRNSEGADSCWRWSKDKINKEDTVSYSPVVIAKQKRNGEWNIYEKSRKSTTKAKSIWDDTAFISEQGTTELGALGLKGLFDHPKPIELISKVIKISTEENDVILDFFAGSATTANAVLELNKHGGNRKFICVQIPEINNEFSEPFKAGYKTIADISKERIKRVIEKIKKERDIEKSKNSSELFVKSDVNMRFDFGFRVYKLTQSNFKVWDTTLEKSPEVIQQKLFEHIQHISPEAQQEAILYELLLKSGFELTTVIEKLHLAGKMIFSIAEGQLLICLEKVITYDCIKEMAEKAPSRVICLDEAFTGTNADALKTNAVQIMKSKGVVNFRTV